jgi:hypothetical protein
VRRTLLGLFLLVQVALGGCHPEGPRDVARAGVITVAGAARAVNEACTKIVTDAVKESEWLSKRQLQAVLEAGGQCETSLTAARPLLETAARLVDASNGPDQWAAACATLQAATELTAAVANVRSVGGKVSPEIDQALSAGKYIGASCSAQ